MSEESKRLGANVEAFPDSAQSTIVSDELKRILDLLRNTFPNASMVSLEFDGQLRAHIDIRKIEEIGIVEERLPFIGGGKLFTRVQRGKTPNHPFHHRISALVLR